MALTSEQNRRIDLWIAALRSGEFTQGVHNLTIITPQGVKDCCLGVLCKVAKREGLVVSAHVAVHVVSYEGSTIVPPTCVMDWIGMHDPFGSIAVRDLWGSRLDLTRLNDDGFTFNQIADIINYFREDLFINPIKG